MLKIHDFKTPYLKNNYIIILLYAFFVLVGGVIGFLKSESKVSLFASIPSFLALMSAAFSIYKGKRAGHIAAIGILLILDTFFSYRYAQTAKFFPAGLMTLISAATLLILILRIRKRTK